MKKTAFFLTMFASFLYGNKEKYGKVMNLIRGVATGEVDEGFFHVAFDTEYPSVFAALVHHCAKGRFSPEAIEAFIKDKRAFLEDDEQGRELYDYLCEEATRQVNNRQFRTLIKQSTL